MVRTATVPLTTAEAKARFLEVAENLGPLEIARHHPWEAVSVAFALGCLTGSEPDLRRALRDSLLVLSRLL